MKVISNEGTVPPTDATTPTAKHTETIYLKGSRFQMFLCKLILGYFWRSK